jgi:CCR4-NOT transcriptional regulation complex NOT5 subunit
MGNMSYCRFENTLSSLLDCLEHLDDKLEDESELKARNKLIKLCREISARTFKAHVYNLKHDLKYLREHLNDAGIKPYAIYWAKQHSMPEFESTLIKYPEYNQHPDFIKANELYNELKKLCEV